MLQHILYPYPIYVLLFFCLKKTPKALNRVIFETPTEFVAVAQV